MTIQHSAALLKFILAAAPLTLVNSSAFADATISSSTAVQGVAGASGLAGTFYSVPSGSTNYTVAAMLAARDTNAPVGMFSATTLNYAGNDTTNSSILNLLGADAASYVGSSSSINDGVLGMQGYLYVAGPASIVFGINHDDAAQLSVGGTVLISSGCCGYNSNTATFATAGYYAVDMVYSNTYYNGAGSAVFTFTMDGQQGSANLFQSVTAVPEPETYAMLLGGLGLIGCMARRRKST